MLESPFTAFLNHVLASESWARETLAPFAGQVVELRAPPFPALRVAICADGTMRPAEHGPAALVVSAGPQALAAVLRGEEEWLRSASAEGDPRLADAVLRLARQLRWDAEEDLSRVIGDVAAHRIAGAARAFIAWQRDAVQRLGEASVDYLADEKRVLVRKAEHEAHAAGVAELRDAIERLAKRVDRAEPGSG